MNWWNQNEREPVVESGRRNFEGLFIKNKMPTKENSKIKTEELTNKTENSLPESNQLCTAHTQSRTSKLISENPHSAASPYGQGSPLRGGGQRGGRG